MTAVISGVAAGVSFLDANQVPQKRWFKARAQAEALRSLYYIYISRQKPFEIITSRDRVHKMREKVLDILSDTASANRPVSPRSTQQTAPAPKAQGSDQP
jgi:hypothetical protein